jgi:hypothetical protein
MKPRPESTEVKHVPRSYDPAPILDLHPTGDGRAVARVLAQIFVRQELISEGMISGEDRCQHRPTRDDFVFSPSSIKSHDRSHVLSTLEE